MKDNIKAVLFDVDDTLYDRKKSQPLVLNTIINQFPGLFSPFNKDQVLDAFLESDRISTESWESGFHMDDIRDYRSKLFLDALGLPDKHAAAISETYVRNYPDVYAPVDGAIELVKKVSQLFKTGIISNSMPDVQYQKLQTLGLRNLFSCIVIATEVGFKKPDPKIFQYTADMLKVRASDCLYIRDSYENDVAGAKGAGMKAGWFCRDSRPYSENSKVRADFKVSSLKEFEEIILG